MDKINLDKVNFATNRVQTKSMLDTNLVQIDMPIGKYEISTKGYSMRFDKYVQQKFNLKSRTYAENLIKTGCVLLNGEIVSKTAVDVGDSDVIEIKEDKQFASQGAYKLEKAFEEFDISVKGLRCADIGCSNGGFTDLLLRVGASHVLAVDVGECALPKDILNSGKVEFLRANARELPDDIEKVDFLCADLSFISLKLVLSQMYKIMKVGAHAVVLVKPQFELDKSALNKNGIVMKENDRQKALNNVKSYAITSGFEIVGETVSPIRYENKNVEYLLYLRKY